MKTMLRASLAFALGGAPALVAQQPAAAPAPAIPAVVDSADVKTVDGIMRAIYAVISGDSGVRRDWDRFRSLFAPGARLIPTGPRGQGRYGIRMLTPDEYATLAGPNLERTGFHERELARRTESYGPITHLFSSYDSKRRASDPAPFARGINSFQLYNDGARWYIVSIHWWNETGETPIPARYLTTENH